MAIIHKRIEPNLAKIQTQMGFFFFFFSKFCELGRLGIIHKRNEPNLAKGQT
jgi:hypothetical protein